MKLKNIPNILSVIRIMLVAVFVYSAFCISDKVALVVFLIAGATDVLDGYLARRNNWITDLGKILDPFADKLMQCTVLVSLYIKRYIPIWFVIPFFHHLDLVISVMQTLARSIHLAILLYMPLCRVLFLHAVE